MRLTDSQIVQFYEDGYLVVEDALTKDDLRPVIEEYEAIIEQRAQRLYEEGKIKSLYADEPFERRLACLAAEAPEVAGGLDIMQTRGPAVFNFLHNPNLLDLIEPLVGTEILCNPIQHLRAILPLKLTPKARPTQWHQDVGVCWPDADPYFMLTVWIPIVDATLENGCLEVIPRSHKYGLRQHVMTPYGLEIPPQERPPGEPKPLPVRAGGVILFHNYTLHHARPNESDTVRWSFDLRYHDAYQPTGRPFYPAFLVRSKARPDMVLRDHKVWVQRWEFALKASQGVKMYRWS